ncbi:2355_t:CDS:2, partial [Gigaspora margarita]
ISIFDTTNLKWLSMTTHGDQIGSRFGHSAVLTQNGFIIIYGGLGSTFTQVLPDVAVLDVNTTPYAWKAITDKAPQALTYHSARQIVPSQPLPASSKMTLNNNLYIFNTKNYTWVNKFDASNIYGSNSTNSDSITLGEKINIGIGVVIAVSIMQL